jgi:hypothetical protein
MHAVEGMLAGNELQCLFSLAQEVDSGMIIEIGSYRGRSTIALAYGSLAGSKVSVYAVEPHQPFEGPLGGKFGPQDKVAFFRHVLLAGAGEIVYLINLSSEQAVAGWHQSIGLLWIDGDHSYEGAKKDFELWSPFVVTGGRIAFHDSTDPSIGPYHVVREATESGEFELEKQVNKITILLKT